MQKKLEEAEYKRMTEEPVRDLIISLGIPTTIGMLITSIYNLADTYFVSQIGTSAAGAVGIVFSLMAIIQAIGFTIGIGAGSNISRYLGRRDNEKASMYGSTAVLMALGIGLLVTLFGHLFLDTLMYLLGATKTVLPFAKSYATYILWAAPIMAMAFVLNNILRAEGNAKFAMIGITIGGLLNVLLDPILIFYFDMGIKGAALATLLSQLISFGVLLVAFLNGSSVVVLSLKKISMDYKDYREIIYTGFPALCRQGLASISTILLNSQASVYGDAALAAMNIVTKITMFVFAVGLGFGQGYQPVAGYNYGAKKWERVSEAFLFVLKLGTGVLLVLCGTSYMLAPKIMSLFINEREVIDIGVNALRYQAIALPVLCINVTCNMTFQVIGRKTWAAILSCLRQGLFFVPYSIILPKCFGLLGVELIQAASDFSTVLFSIPFACIFFREVEEEIKNKKE